MAYTDTGSQKVYPVIQQQEEQQQKDFESPDEITEALTNAVLDMEMAEELQLEEKEEKLFNNKMVEVEQQMRIDISNAVRNIKYSDGDGKDKSDGLNDQLVEDEIKMIQDEATYTLEEKALEKLESKVKKIVNEAELEVEEIITEDQEEGMDANDIVEDIETLELIAEKDIEQETDSVEKEIETSLDSLSKQVICIKGMDANDIVEDIETLEMIVEKDIEQETDAVEKEIETSLDSLSKQVIRIKGMDANDIVEDIEILELIGEKDIEQETDAVEKEIETSLDSLSKQVEKEVIKKKLGFDFTDSNYCNMFTYSPTDPTCIIACELSNVKFIGEDNVSVENGGILADALFPIDSVWKDRALLFDAVSLYAVRTGWKCCLKNLYKIRCSCYKTTPNLQLNSSQGSINKSCTWLINMKSSKYTAVIRGGNHKHGQMKRIPDFGANITVTITKNTCLKHGSSCCPSAQQQLVQRSRAGDYVTGLSTLSLYYLCNTLQTSGKLKFSVLRDSLRQQFPCNKNVTNQNIWNMRRKVNSILPSMVNIKSFKDFQSLCNTSNIAPGLDNTPLSNDDVAVVAKEIWEEIMSNDPNEDAIITFKEYMKLLKKSNKGFRYQLFYDTTGKCTGCVWQTATMRDNFERFGGFVALDAMKRELNSLLWPYMAITMYNELNMICLCCKAIVISERKEAYKALLNFVCDEKHSSRLKNDIAVLAADGAVTQHIVTHEFQLLNCHFMADQWHLFDSVLPNRFVETPFQSIKDYLRKMCYSNSEEEHTTSFNAAMSILQNRPLRTGKPEEELVKFRNEKSSYASYILSAVKGSKGKHGSSLAESNHSSALVFLNDGEKQFNNYKEKPHTLVKDLFQRESMHVNKFNQEMYNQKIRLDTDRGKFNSSIHKALVSAIDCLCLFSYKKFKSRVSRLSEYEMIEISDNQRVVKSKKYVNATPKHCFRNEVSGHFICQSCEGSIAYEEQCEHSLMCNDEMFIASHFNKRHFRRDVCNGIYLNEDDLSQSSSNSLR